MYKAQHISKIEMLNEWIDTAIGALITAIGTFFWKLYRQWKNQSLEKTLHEREQNWVSVGNITRDTRFGRAYVLRTSNGGGIPTANKPLHGTVLYCTGDEFPNIEDYWQSRPVGRVLNSILLATITSEEGAHYITEELQKGEFRDMLKAHSVVYGRCRKIIESKDGKSCYWLMIDSKEEISLMHPEKDLINNTINTLSANLVDD